MEQLLTWRDTWLLGIDTLDADHRKMVELINRLAQPASTAEAPDSGRQDDIKRRLGELISFLRVHFKTEERFLESINYPDYGGHKNAHAVQIAEFIDMRRYLTETGADALDDNERQSIKNWFFNHVIAEDRVFARYYLAQCGTLASRASADAGIHRRAQREMVKA